MTTIEATNPDTARLARRRASTPGSPPTVRSCRSDAVYPSGQNVKEIEEHNTEQMEESQDAATEAALNYLDLSDKDVKVTLKLADVGGPSAGLLFTLGIIDKLTATAAAATSRAAAPSRGRARSTRPVRSARSAEWH